jgi:hypothetical protein
MNRTNPKASDKDPLLFEGDKKKIPHARVQQQKIWWSVCDSSHLFRQNSMDKSSMKITAWSMM